MAFTVRRATLPTAQTKSLIEHVKSHACLWNPDHEDTCLRYKTACAWADIAKKMNLSEDLIRAKWKNLRDIFIKEVKKRHLTSVDDYDGKWKYFRALWFLCRLVSVERDSSEDEASETTDAFDPRTEPLVKVETHDNEPTLCTFLNKEVNETATKTDRGEKNENDRDYTDFLASKRRRLNAYGEEECDMMFLMSLAPYLKLLNPIKKLVVRNKIQETILKELDQGTANGPL